MYEEGYDVRRESAKKEQFFSQACGILNEHLCYDLVKLDKKLSQHSVLPSSLPGEYPDLAKALHYVELVTKFIHNAQKERGEDEPAYDLDEVKIGVAAYLHCEYGPAARPLMYLFDELHPSELEIGSLSERSLQIYIDTTPKIEEQDRWHRANIQSMRDIKELFLSVPIISDSEKKENYASEIARLAHSIVYGRADHDKVVEGIEIGFPDKHTEIKELIGFATCCMISKIKEAGVPSAVKADEILAILHLPDDDQYAREFAERFSKAMNGTLGR